MNTLIDVLIRKRGRLYYDCFVRVDKIDFPAKLVINEASKNLAVGDRVTFYAEDLTTADSYGIKRKYSPVQRLTDADLKQIETAKREAAAVADAEKWLRYAESDAANGSYKTNAIRTALLRCGKYEHLTDRISALNARVAENKTKWAQQNDNRRQSAKQRHLYPLATRPPLNTPVQFRNKTVIYHSYGSTFRIDCDHPSMYGSHLLGHEGESGCYCYYTEEN